MDLTEYAQSLKVDAERGLADAQFSYGLCCHLGELGVPQNHAEALRWYRLAAQQGNVEAQHNLGSMLTNGEGAPQDYVEGMKWYRMAAEQGDVESQFAVGYYYDYGLLGAQDHAEAVKWYRMAAEQGLTKAQFKLGRAYSNGEGLQQDYVQAHKWFNLTAAGDTTSDRDDYAELRDNLATAFLSREEVVEAQRLAREWRPKTWEELRPRD